MNPRQFLIQRDGFTLLELQAVIASVAFSPDGNRLASANWDNTVKIWDATPRAEASPADAKAR